MKRLYRLIQAFIGVFIPHERKARVNIGILQKIRLWRRGFYANKYILYRLDRNSPKHYLSDYDRVMKTSKVNSFYKVMLDDKLYFSLMMKKLGDYVPEVYGVITNGEVHFFDNKKKDHRAGIVEFVRENRRVVLKPQKGGGGRGVMVAACENGNILLNGREIPDDEFLSVVKELKHYLVCEFIHQHRYASSIFPHTPNSIRIVTMWDDETGSPFIAGAVHRFGCTATIPVDNFSQGGASAKVDLQSGRLEKIALVINDKLVFGEKHPETGEAVEGVTIPHWETVTASILDLAGTLKFLPLIGWDVIVTEKSLKLVEANSYPDVDILQTHSVILDDPRIRNFYRNWGVLRK